MRPRGCVIISLAVTASTETARALETADEEAICLAAAKRAGVYPSDFPFQLARLDRVLRGGEEWRLGDTTFQGVRTPGHSRDMMSYLVRREDRPIPEV